MRKNDIIANAKTRIKYNIDFGTQVLTKRLTKLAKAKEHLTSNSL
jgi:hypothetical protein